MDTIINDKAATGLQGWQERFSSIFIEIGNSTVLFTVIVAVLSTLCLGLVSFIRKKHLKKSKSVLILGQSGSGKTALFLQLQSSKIKDTVSSLIPNSAEMNLLGNDSKPIEVIDYPGHKQLQHKISSFLPSAGCILYLVDSSDKSSIKPTAEHLLELLADCIIISKPIPILIVFSKTDALSSRPAPILREHLEREIEKLRLLRPPTLEDEEEEEAQQISPSNDTFSFDTASCHVEFCECSVKNGEILDVVNFIKKYFD